MRVVGEIFRYKLELLCYDKCGSAKPQIKAQEVQIMDVNSLAHTKGNASIISFLHQNTEEK